MFQLWVHFLFSKALRLDSSFHYRNYLHVLSFISVLTPDQLFIFIGNDKRTHNRLLVLVVKLFVMKIIFSLRSTALLLPLISLVEPQLWKVEQKLGSNYLLVQLSWLSYWFHLIEELLPHLSAWLIHFSDYWPQDLIAQVVFVSVLTRILCTSSL